MVKNTFLILSLLVCSHLFAQSAKDTIVGKWGLVPDKAVLFEFDAKGYVKIIAGTDTVGGQKFMKEGKPFALKYVINHKTSPKEIDFIFYALTPGGNQEVNRTKGIVDFLSRNTMRLTMNMAEDDKRPQSFQQIDVYGRIY